MAVSKALRFAILQRDNFTCHYCGANGGQLEVDHVIPRALGGRDVPENLVAACHDCNIGKAATCPSLPKPSVAQLELGAALSEVSLPEVLRAIRPIATSRDDRPKKVLPMSMEDEVLLYRRQMLGLIGRGYTVDEAAAQRLSKLPGKERLISIARERIGQEDRAIMREASR